MADLDTDEADDGVSVVEPPSPKKERAPQRRSSIDLDSCTVTIPEVGTFGLANLPSPVISYLTLRGLARELLAAEWPLDKFNDLKAGKLSDRPEAKAKQPNHWRAAIAAALIEAAKKTGSVMTTAEAADRAGRMDRAAVARAKCDPLVVKHYARLTGAAQSILELAA
jgi:hypothetical protein